jgi:hypothetical protein
MEEHEEYPESLMSTKSYDLEVQELLSTRTFETVEHSHTHGEFGARGSFEDTSICVPRAVDLHVEVDLVVHPGSMMQKEYTGGDMSMQGHTMMSDSSQRHAEIGSRIQIDVLDCREETHLGEHVDASPLQQHIVMRYHLHSISSCMGDERWRVVDQESEELLLVVLDDWDSVMTTGEYLSWIPMDEFLVESLGLTKSCDIFQSYSQLQMFLLAFPDTFIIDNSVRRDRYWLRTWRVVIPRSPDMSALTTYSRIGVDLHRQTIETLCVIGISNISEGDVDTNSWEDEHGGLLTVISMTQEQLAGIGSDKLLSLPWDPGVHCVSRSFHFLMTQVALESHILHFGLVLSGLAGTCPIERDNFSHLIIMIEHGDGWASTTSTKILLQMQLLDNRSNCHRYFSLRIQEWGI